MVDFTRVNNEMRKQREEVKKATIKRTIIDYFCDACGEKKSTVSTCDMCKGDFCKKCIVYDYNDSDYEDIYCKNC